MMNTHFRETLESSFLPVYPCRNLTLSYITPHIHCTPTIPPFTPASNGAAPPVLYCSELLGSKAHRSIRVQHIETRLEENERKQLD